MKLRKPHNGATVNLHTKVQQEFIERIQANGIIAAQEWLRIFKKNQELSYPESVHFSWETEEEEVLLEISESPDFDNARKIRVKGTEWAEANLLIGHTYFWRVNGSTPFCFETEGVCPRFVRVDGVLNVRDLGGGKIRQGLAYRGSELNGYFNISEEGKKTFTEQLRIKTQLDLRLEWFEKLDASPAGETVRLVQIPYRPYKEVFEERYRNAICEIMDLFADESNYPVYFHCVGGADRTGMIAQFLRAIAGETEETLHLDYELTSLSSYAFDFNSEGFRFRTAPYYVEFLNMLEAYAPGEPLEMRLLAFLEACGVTKACMAKIRAILTAQER